MYDRWGEKVFEAQNIAPNIPNLGWDGFFKGKATDSGIYSWIVEVEFIDGVKSVYKGSSTLIR